MRWTPAGSAEATGSPADPSAADPLGSDPPVREADRLADAFGFELLSPEGFEAGAKYLLKQGYR